MDKWKLLRIAFLVLGVILLAAGIIVSDFTNVFLKASKICYECIGIG